MLTRADEEDLIEDIREGAGIALAMRGSSADSIDSIKLNKLVYLAIKELELPITFGWYKYGPAPVELEYSETAVEARPKEDHEAPYDSRLPRRDFLSPVGYAYFFENKLDEFSTIIEAPTKEFLIEFYERNAPEPYTDLYVKNAQLQQILDEIKDDSSWHKDAETYYREVSQRFGELNRELSGINILRDVRDPMREYTRFVKRMLAEASELESMSATQQRHIKRIINYYYGAAWKFVALNISKDTVHLSPGDNDRKLITSIENDLQELRADYSDDLKSLEERAESLELFSRSVSEEPDDSAYPSEEESDRQDVKLSELWAKASSEAIRSSARKTEQ